MRPQKLRLITRVLITHVYLAEEGTIYILMQNLVPQKWSGRVEGGGGGGEEGMCE